MKRAYSNDEAKPWEFAKHQRLETHHRLQIIAGTPSSFASFNVRLELICEHSGHFQNLYSEGTIRYGMEEAIMLHTLTPEFFRAYLERLEDSSFDLAHAVKVGQEAVDTLGASDENQVLTQLHRLCTWWQGADFLEDCRFKNAIMDVLVEQVSEPRPEVLSGLAYLVAGDDMKQSGLRLCWLDCVAAKLSEDSIDELCRELPKDLVVDLLKAQVRLSKAEDSRDRPREAERYYDQKESEAGDVASAIIAA